MRERWCVCGMCIHAEHFGIFGPTIITICSNCAFVCMWVFISRFNFLGFFLAVVVAINFNGNLRVKWFFSVKLFRSNKMKELRCVCFFQRIFPICRPDQNAVSCIILIENNWFLVDSSFLALGEFQFNSFLMRLLHFVIWFESNGKTNLNQSTSTYFECFVQSFCNFRAEIVRNSQ